MKKMMSCQRCGHSWEPRDGTLPKSCPKCKTYKYATPRPVQIARSKKKAQVI